MESAFKAVMTRKTSPDGHLFFAYLTAAPKSGPRSGVVLPGFQKNRCP
jgi:hypothetical protein